MVIKKIGKWEISEDELERKLQRSLQLGREDPQASASKFIFNRSDKTIRIELPGNAFLTFPAANIKELQGATDEEIEQGELIANGTLLRWNKFDADYSIEGFTHGRYGTAEWMRLLGQRGGQSKSTAKVAASRKNGQRGGRPRSMTIASLFPTNVVGATEVLTATALDIVSVGHRSKIKSIALLDLSFLATTTNNIVCQN